MAFSIRRYLERVYHDLVLAPRGFGRAVDQSVWERQYRGGEWTTLQSMDEMAHYAFIAGYARLLHPRPAMLDAGCGAGELFKWVEPWSKSYIGIDIAEAAIAQAKTIASDKARFSVAKLEEWQSDSRFNIIVFNESIYYTHDPQATLRRFATFLKPDGVFIVSMCEYGQNASVWARLDEIAHWLHGTSVRNCKGQAWEIRAGRLETAP